MEVEAVKLLAAAIALFPMFGVGLALGNIFASFNEAAGRNPTAEKVLDKKFFIAAALTEALGLFAFVGAMLILFLF
jgi:F-type H+-transporting ATPase subunit c